MGEKQNEDAEKGCRGQSTKTKRGIQSGHRRTFNKAKLLLENAYDAGNFQMAYIP
jgi:hypothetical protein